MDTRNDFEREVENLKRMLQDLPNKERAQQFAHRADRTAQNFGDRVDAAAQKFGDRVDQAARQFSQNMNGTARPAPHQAPPATGYRTPQSRQTGYRPPQPKPPVQNQNPPVKYSQNHQPAPPYQPTWLQKQGKIVGKTPSVLLRTFGLIGAIPSGIFTGAAMLMQYLRYGVDAAIAIGIPTGAVTLVFVIMTMIGMGISKKVKRCKKYRTLFGNNKMVTFDQLSQLTQRSKRYLLKDIKKMIRNGSLSEVYMDAGQTCVILDQETYRQYLQLENRRKNLESQQNEQSRIADGHSYVRQIRLANDALPGQDISEKLFRLEAITLKIFEYIDKHPEKLDQVDKFMNYYMPTVTKLVSAYQEFEAQPIQGENILGAKREIESMLDTVCVAFENVLDGLFAENAMDISSDISVMETMFRQDGLTKDDITSASKKE